MPAKMPRSRLWGPITMTRPSLADASQLDTFPNPCSDRDYEIRFDCPEFTCVCPKTGQPDFAAIEIRYVPDVLCVELKSLKLYLFSYRDVGAFHEAVTNRILDDLAELVSPRAMEIAAHFFVRGGITTRILVRQGNPGLLAPLPPSSRGTFPPPR